MSASNSLCQKRVQREVKEIVNSKDLNEHGVLIEVLENNLQNLRGYLRGPPGSPYDGARFALQIKIPDAYPFKPPAVQFMTRVWHPNVSSATGMICLDILKENWAASMTLRTVLLSVQALLTLPEPKDPQDAVVASQYMNKPELFKANGDFLGPTLRQLHGFQPEQEVPREGPEDERNGIGRGLRDFGAQLQRLGRRQNGVGGLLVGSSSAKLHG